MKRELSECFKLFLDVRLAICLLEGEGEEGEGKKCEEEDPYANWKRNFSKSVLLVESTVGK
jgi:hypothetical protein